MKSIKAVQKLVLKAAKMANKGQNDVERSYKKDGSVLTKIDKEVDDFLYDSIKKLYPNVNIITEETAREYNPEKDFTFTIDPIDGTDAFSQGMPGWAISVGLLNKDLEPIAGCVYLPHWGSGNKAGTFLFADINAPTYCNGKILENDKVVEKIEKNSQLMICSSTHKSFDLSKYIGKIRSGGSAISNAAAVMLHSGIIAGLFDPICIWDITAIDAIIRAANFKLETLKGGTLDYSKLIDGSRGEDCLISGTTESIRIVRETFSKLKI